MQRQVEMERTMQVAHKQFIEKLEESIELLEEDIKEASGMQQICTDEWCSHTEAMVDELHKFVYSISEPSWTDAEDSRKLRNLRHKLHDLYASYKNVIH
jgi:hypothetical protein